MQTSQMIFYFEDPIAFLNSQLRERQKKNPKFSLRAWARQMGYQNPSLLFQVLKGERRLKMDLAMKVANNLSLKGKALRYFELIVLNSASQTDTERRMYEEMLVRLRPKKFREMHKLSLEAFAVMADWYHGAILALTEFPDFEPDISWLQARIGHDLDKKTLKEAVDRLINVGLLVALPDGKFGPAQKDGSHAAIMPSVPSEAIRQHHRQMIEKARDAVDQQTIDERYLQSHTLAFNKKLLPQVQEIIAEAHRQIGELSEKLPASEREDVYQLNTQFFRLTKRKPEPSH